MARDPKKGIRQQEFIALMALLMSLVAMSIDAMLPALEAIAGSLGVRQGTDIQYVVSSVFFGMCFGFMVFGPLSDILGRKKVILIGVSFFIVGGLISLSSTNMFTMIFGRLLQGFGGSSCRVVTIAMIRDKFEGAQMAKVMSLIMILFVAIPAVAPFLGSLILLFAGWRFIFAAFVLVGIIGMTWFYWRQPETLAIEKRSSFVLGNIAANVWETITHRQTLAYTAAGAMAFGAFIGYLSTAQQIFQKQYGLGKLFTVYFGGLALMIGISSFINFRLVVRIGMEKLCVLSLSFIFFSSLGFYFFAQSHHGHPPLLFFYGYLIVNFLSFGILYSNLNTLAVNPHSHIAGVASSTISSVQTFGGVLFGSFVGHAYDGTILPLVFGFLVSGAVSLALILWTIRDPIGVKLKN